MVEVRGTGILQLSRSSRESGQPSKFSVTGDPALDVCASAPQREETDDWPRLEAIADRWLPKPSILHPYPNLRFDAKHGSVRGRQVNWRPYRDPKPLLFMALNQH